MYEFLFGKRKELSRCNEWGGGHGGIRRQKNGIQIGRRRKRFSRQAGEKIGAKELASPFGAVAISPHDLK